MWSSLLGKECIAAGAYLLEVHCTAPVLWGGAVGFTYCSAETALQGTLSANVSDSGAMQLIHGNPSQFGPQWKRCPYCIIER